MYYTYDVSMALTLRIRQLREARGLTIQDLADMIGVSKPHLSGVERGIKNLNNHLIEKIASALDVEPFELIISQEDEKVVRFARAILDGTAEDRASARADINKASEVT